MTARRRVIVIVNAKSGSGAGFERIPSRSEAGSAHDGADPIERLERLFAERGVDADVRPFRGGDDIAAAVRAAVDERPDAVVAGGGDGTVSAVAAALVDTDIALGVLPLGTLNHFAKDVGLPLEVDKAVEHVARGAVARIDVAEVNGRIFVNNSGLGLYPDIVRHRERQQQRLGRGKWPALVWASLDALRRYPFLDVRLAVDGDERSYRTPFVFIGNNAYRMDGLAIGERDGLADGVLCLYVARRPGRWRLFQLALRALVGRLEQERDFDALQAAEIVIESRHRRLRVATDGEVQEMTPPLRYRIRPASLGVLRIDNPTTAPAP